MTTEIYRITPLEKKSIKNTLEVYRENEDESISWFTIDDHYRWGHGFIESKHFLPSTGEQDVYCESQVGWGAELEDQVAFFIEFSDDISEEEQKEIEKNYLESGAVWLYEEEQKEIEKNYLESGAVWLYEEEHNWVVDHDMIIVSPPFQIDQVDPEEYGKVIKENVTIE